eukprot:TRINITY_DN6809_c0_g2_i1.p1 TRINITY_DN6809_c0_g2~~TRINITY_DN6809_c0_g2_i1.p1  ORF type:complete len:424 (+),score=83.09 TRINITY_DN6809_c0_g2_i1:347-1618(+)
MKQDLEERESLLITKVEVITSSDEDDRDLDSSRYSTTSSIATEVDFTPTLPSKTYYEAILCVIPVFAGYACLFALQREVKNHYNLQSGSRELFIFGIAASFVYLGNLIFRLGHNIIFAYFYPRTRVLISMSCMAMSMLIITLIFFAIPNPSLAWVFVAYGFGGAGIGTFESNLLSTISSLGKQTKLWAIIGMPTGIILITVGGFALLETGLNAGWIYLGTLIGCLMGMGVFLLRIYRCAGTGNAISLKDFFLQISHWRIWLPVIKWHSLALMLDMFWVSMFSPGVILYIYQTEKVVSFGNLHIRNDWMFAIYDAFFFLGDTLSRKLLYNFRTIFPLFFLVLSFAGAAAGLSHVIWLIFICPLFVAFANGAIYSQANRHIDTHVDKRYSLVAFSFWLFLGDVGSVVGSNLIQYVNLEVGRLYHH